MVDTRRRFRLAEEAGARVPLPHVPGDRHLDLPYQCGPASTDSPTARIFFREGARVRLLDHDHGCEGAPAIVTTLEDELDRITGTAQWTERVGFNTPMDLAAHEPPFRLDGNELRSAWK